MLKRRSMVILVVLMICSLILPYTNAGAATKSSKKVIAKTVSITKPNTSTYTIVKGKTQKLKTEITPVEASAKLQWKSSNRSVVSVTGNGTMKGLKNGTAIITAAATDGSKVKDTITVTVGTPVTGVTVAQSKITLTEGKTGSIKTAVKPSKASNKKVTYKSSNKKVAMVSTDGKIKAVSAGKATITITAQDGSGNSAKVSVTVKSKQISRTLTDKDIMNGVITITNKSYDYLTITNTVGDAKIVLNHVTVKSELRMEAGAKYSVTARDSKINAVIAEEEAAKRLLAYSPANENISETKTPTFIAESGTLIVTIDARGNFSVKQDGQATIEKVTVNRKLDGKIELNLDGFKGNLVVNTISNADIAITTQNCNIGEATISGTSSGQKLSISDINIGGEESKIEKIKVATNAYLVVNIPAQELTIDKSIAKASVAIDKPINAIINNGSSTRLSVNSNVSSIVSSGDSMEMKVTAGSTVKNIEIAGNSTKVEVALGSTVEAVNARGNASEITGDGKVNEVNVEGNNTKVNTSGSTVKVSNGVTGTTANGASVPTGTTVINNPGNSGGNSGDGSNGNSGNGNNPPVTGTKIVIKDPGKIWAGNNVQLSADMKDVIWSVYSYIDGYGYANIDEDTGLLHPVSTGTVRVAARSKSNPMVYGAVDIKIQGKKFVSYASFDPIVIDSDESVIDLNALRASGKLPDHVDMIYETGSGKETETITVDIDSSSWFGEYSGDLIGNYCISSFFYVPSGYERPEDTYAAAIVKVTVPQTNNLKVIDTYITPEPIILTKNENLVKIEDLFSKYVYNTLVILNCEDGTVLETAVEGYSVDSGNQFNGAVPGKYSVNYYVPLPNGYVYNNSSLYNTYVYWNSNNYLNIPVDIIVNTPQTTKETNVPKGTPDTTQPKFEDITSRAAINAVKLSQVPIQGYAGDIVDLKQYLEVLTDSELGSDKRVKWIYDGYVSYNYLTSSGVLLLANAGTHTIMAKSVIDESKFAQVTIEVINNKEITQFNPLADIVLEEDQNITNFKKLYSHFKKQLPKYVIAVSSTGEELRLPIKGWNISENYPTAMVLEAEVRMPQGYKKAARSYQVISIFKPQTDNRIKVVTGSAIDVVVNLPDEKYATNSSSLIAALYGDKNSYENYINIKAQLEDGTEVPMRCRIAGHNVKDANTGSSLFKGKAGKYIASMQISLPDEYTYNSANSYFDIEIEVQVIIEADQTPLYEGLWVNIEPRLSYTAGEYLDLSNLLVTINDTTHLETDSRVVIGYNKFQEYGLELHLDNEYGDSITAETPLTTDMDGSYIIIFNPVNYNSTNFGPLSVQ